ncbi:MAG TPA: DUF6328 family protein [Streptosporangiaceae bacterium]|nr:DUF6328 family protein [Streptosporangiaceae bacterium]
MSTEPPDPRHETQEERDDRNLIELLQELRVGGLGVQVLFGFLLALPFTTRFVQLHLWQRDLYTGVLLTSAVATALLLGPVAYHRLVFRRRQKEHLVRAANVMAIAGLVAVAIAVSGTVLLVVSYVDKTVTGVVIGSGMACLFGGLWFAYPLVRRGRSRRSQTE